MDPAYVGDPHLYCLLFILLLNLVQEENYDHSLCHMLPTEPVIGLHS